MRHAEKQAARCAFGLYLWQNQTKPDDSADYYGSLKNAAG